MKKGRRTNALNELNELSKRWMNGWVREEWMDE